MKNKKLLFFMLLPLTTYASGGEVLAILWFELVAIIISMFFIFTLNWKIRHKLILTIIYFICLVYSNIIFGNLHYNHDIYLVSTLLSIVPISCLFIGYLILRKQYN